MKEEEPLEDTLKNEKIEVTAESVLTAKQEPQQPLQERKDSENTMYAIKEQNEALFQVAYGERKNMNTARINEYMGKRTKSSHERTKIFTIIRAKYQDKQKYTKAFVKGLTKFFEQYVSIYHNLKKAVSKFDLSRKYKTQISYSGVRESIEELLSLNQRQLEHVEKFIDWIEKVLIEGLKSSDNYFRERMKKVNKELQKISSDYNTAQEKEGKAYQKLTEGNDLLEKQYILMEKIKITNQQSIKRMTVIYESWQALLKQEQDLKKMMSDSVLQFHERLIKFHKRTQNKTDGAHGILKYWSKLPPAPEAITVFASFIDPKDCEFMAFGCQSKKLHDTFEDFILMLHEEKRVGNPLPFLDILIAKKFKGKIQQNQRDWKEIGLIFTVDHNLIFVDERKGETILKLKERGLQLARPSENILQVCGLELGVIFDSNRKRMVHFETLDEVEEFCYYVQSIPEQKIK